MHRYLQQNCNVCMEWPLKDLIASMTSMLYMPVISPQATVISPTSTHGGELVVLANRPSDEMTMKSDVTENVI